MHFWSSTPNLHKLLLRDEGPKVLDGLPDGDAPAAVITWCCYILFICTFFHQGKLMISDLFLFLWKMKICPVQKKINWSIQLR